MIPLPRAAPPSLEGVLTLNLPAGPPPPRKTDRPPPPAFPADNGGRAIGSRGPVATGRRALRGAAPHATAGAQAACSTTKKSPPPERSPAALRDEVPP